MNLCIEFCKTLLQNKDYSVMMDPKAEMAFFRSSMLVGENLIFGVTDGGPGYWSLLRVALRVLI